MLASDIVDDDIERIDFPVIIWKSDNDIDDVFSINETYPTLACTADSMYDDIREQNSYTSSQSMACKIKSCMRELLVKNNRKNKTMHCCFV